MKQLHTLKGTNTFCSAIHIICRIVILFFFLLHIQNIQHQLFQFSSVTQSCPTLCNPMDCSTPGLPVPPHPPKFARVHAHCIDDAILPSHPLAHPLLLLPSVFPLLDIIFKIIFPVTKANDFLFRDNSKLKEVFIE